MKTRKKKTRKFNSHKHVSKEKVAKMLRGLFQSGQILSNMAFKHKQLKKFKEDAQRLDFWHTRWDDDKLELPDWMKS